MYVCEYFFPDSVHLFNYTLTKGTFDTLCRQKHYHAAAFVIEQDPGILSDSINSQLVVYDVIDVYEHIGEYNTAEKLLLNEFDRFHVNSESPDLMKCLRHLNRFVAAVYLSDLYDKIGDYEKQNRYCMYAESEYNALKKYKETINEMIAVADGSSDDYDYFSFITDGRLKPCKIKNLYHKDKLTAIAQLKQFVTKTISQGNYAPALVLQNMSLLIKWLQTNGQTAESLKYLRIAEDVIISNYKSANPTISIDDKVFQVTGELSQAFFYAGDETGGYRMMRIYDKYLNSAYSDNDTERLKGRMLLCRYYETKRDIENLTPVITEICNGLKTEITKNFAGFSTEQIEAFVNTLTEPFDFAVKAAMEFNSPELAELCMENLIFERGLTLRSELELNKTIRNSKNPSLLIDYKKWRDINREIATREEMTGLGNTYILNKLKHETEELNKKISSYDEYKKAVNNKLPTVKALRKTLNDNEYYVELSQFAENNDTVFYALVLSEKENVKFVKLCNDTDIQDYVYDGIPYLYMSQNTDFTNTLLSPLLRLLPEGSRIYLTTSGLFSKLSIPALCVSKNKYLSDIYNIRLLSSPMTLCLENNSDIEINGKTDISLWGGINYGKTEQDTLTDGERAFKRGIPIRKLDGSKKEVLKINEIFENYGIRCELYTGGNATKSKFLKSKPHILHISTHGAFNGAGKINPLYNSLLFFANANEAWLNPLPENVNEHGIVNGIDIESMNLGSCELAVLSACETGLGTADTREGVIGLQRAFKLAGVKKIIMTMWNVSDDATQMFMVAFYDYLLKDKKHNVNDAFAKARNMLRKSVNYNNPYYWGAFVLLD